MQVLYHGTISSGNVFSTGQEFGETSINFAEPTYIYIIQILGEGDTITLKPSGNSKSSKNQLIHSETRNIFTPIEVFGSDNKSTTYQYLQWICPMTRPMTVVDQALKCIVVRGIFEAATIIVYGTNDPNCDRNELNDEKVKLTESISFQHKMKEVDSKNQEHLEGMDKENSESSQISTEKFSESENAGPLVEVETLDNNNNLTPKFKHTQLKPGQFSTKSDFSTNCDFQPIRHPQKFTTHQLRPKQFNHSNQFDPSRQREKSSKQNIFQNLENFTILASNNNKFRLANWKSLPLNDYKFKEFKNLAEKQALSDTKISDFKYDPVIRVFVGSIDSSAPIQTNIRGVMQTTNTAVSLFLEDTQASSNNLASLVSATLKYQVDSQQMHVVFMDLIGSTLRHILDEINVIKNGPPIHLALYMGFLRNLSHLLVSKTALKALLNGNAPILDNILNFMITESKQGDVWYFLVSHIVLRIFRHWDLILKFDDKHFMDGSVYRVVFDF